MDWRCYINKQNFLDFFTERGFSIKTSDFIYENTQTFLKAKDLVLLPHDDLINLYERSEDEWFYIINKWFNILGKKAPDQKTLNDLLIKHKEISFEYLMDLFDKQV